MGISDLIDAYKFLEFLAENQHRWVTNPNNPNMCRTSSGYESRFMSNIMLMIYNQYIVEIEQFSKF